MNRLTSFADQGSTRARFSAAEFVHVFQAAQALDIRLELIDGELERMTPPMGAHSHRQTGVIAAMLPIVGRRAMVEAAIDLGEDTILVCDVVVLRAPMAEHRFLRPGEVTLAVEIAETTLDRDMGLKRARYAGAGIPEYWVVDGGRAVIHVCREPIDGDYALISTVRFGEPIALPGTDETIVLG